MADAASYHFDLRHKATAKGATPDDGAAHLARLTADPARANPVDIVQVGLGAMQLGEAWLPVVDGVAAWIERTADDRGGIAYRFPMPHTYALAPPWYSGLAQGEAASFLVRAAEPLGRSGLHELAERVAAPLLSPDSGLVVATADGPVLEEYPTSPPSYVLNGWIIALFGLHDVGAVDAFDAGVESLASRLHRYDTAIGWSRYDLYPHRFTNVASPWYHRFHVELLRTLDTLAPRPAFGETADRWHTAAANPATAGFALSRKALFRLARPRWRQLG